MKREGIDKTASEIFKMMIKTDETFDHQQESCKRFYRKISRWHLKKLEGLNSYKNLLKSEIIVDIEDLV
jgi:hypothetical protein